MLDDQLYTFAEAAMFAHQSIRTIFRRVETGDLEAVRPPGSKHRRITGAALRAYMAGELHARALEARDRAVEFRGGGGAMTRRSGGVRGRWFL